METINLDTKYLFGHHNLIPCFENHFDFIDIVIYRFYKSIPNIAQYTKKLPITHSYFLIFKKREQ